MLSSELATLLSGRYVEFHIYPFRFEEYCTMTQQAKNRQSYVAYLNTGGLPGMFELPSSESKRLYVASVKDTIMLRDIIQRKQWEANVAAVRDAKLLDVQCSHSIENEDTKRREYASLLGVQDSYEKWVVTLDELQHPVVEGIKHIQAWNLAASL